LIWQAMPGLTVESLGGPASMRGAITFPIRSFSGLTTHKNDYDFRHARHDRVDVDEGFRSRPARNFWEWLQTADLKI
jgi:branched-chain amino acid transport system substrate-binding protein